MLEPEIGGTSVLADDVAALASFYETGLGLPPEVVEEHYVAFGGAGVRLAWLPE